MALFGQPRLGGGGGLRGGNASTGVNVNFQPAANYWDGDNFVIPGITPGYAGQGQAMPGQDLNMARQQMLARLQQRQANGGAVNQELLNRLLQRLGQQQAAPTQPQEQGFKSFAPYNLRPYGGLLG